MDHGIGTVYIHPHPAPGPRTDYSTVTVQLNLHIIIHSHVHTKHLIDSAQWAPWAQMGSSVMAVGVMHWESKQKYQSQCQGARRRHLGTNQDE